MEGKRFTRRCALRCLGILSDALIRSTGIALPVDIVSLEERVGERATGTREFLVQEADLPELKKICVEKLRASSRGRALRQNPRLRIFLWKWSEWAPPEEVRSWLDGHAASAKGAIWLLSVLLGESHSWGQEHRVRYFIQLATVDRFADVAKLTQLVQQVNEARLSKQEGRALREFKNALNRRAEGKPDNAFDGCEEEIVD